MAGGRRRRKNRKGANFRQRLPVSSGAVHPDHPFTSEDDIEYSKPTHSLERPKTSFEFSGPHPFHPRVSSGPPWFRFRRRSTVCRREYGLVHNPPSLPWWRLFYKHRSEKFSSFPSQVSLVDFPVSPPCETFRSGRESDVAHISAIRQTALVDRCGRCSEARSNQRFGLDGERARIARLPSFIEAIL